MRSMVEGSALRPRQPLHHRLRRRSPSPYRGGLFQRQQREGREPVLSHIVAGDMGQAGVEMLVGGAASEPGQVRVERVGEAAPAPGSAPP